jgi:hypothetical protein
VRLRAGWLGTSTRNLTIHQLPYLTTLPCWYRRLIERAASGGYSGNFLGHWRGSIFADLYCQELLRPTQPLFTIKFSPVENLVGIYIVPSGNTRHRRTRYQRLFNDLSPLFDAATPELLPMRRTRKLEAIARGAHPLRAARSRRVGHAGSVLFKVKECASRLPSCLTLNRVLSVWRPLGWLDTLLVRGDREPRLDCPELPIVAMILFFCSSRYWLGVFVDQVPPGHKTEPENR